MYLSMQARLYNVISVRVITLYTIDSPLIDAVFYAKCRICIGYSNLQCHINRIEYRGNGYTLFDEEIEDL